MSLYWLTRPHRIRTYLALFAIALTAPLLALAVFALNRMAAIEQSQIERRVAQVAQGLAADIDRELERAVVTLETLTSSAPLAQGDFRAFHAQARRALTRTRAAIVLVDPSFQQLVDTLKDFGEPLPPTADPETARRVIETRQPQVSNLFRGSISGRPVFNVEVPVFDQEGAVRHVLIMSFQAAHIAEVLRGAKLEPPWITGVTDNNGIVLARSERHEDFVGKPLPPDLLAQSRSGRGVYRATNVAGQPILRATVRSQQAGWLVSATVPLSHVEAPRRRSFVFAALLLAAALGLGLLLAFMFGRLMTRPLSDATRLAARVGQGETVTGGVSSLVEANMLTETLGAASSELARRQEHTVFLMRELAHRAKNQLAVVKGLALQTVRQSSSLEDFRAQFDRRLQGLAQSQDILVRENWQGGWLSELVHAHLDVFAAGSRVELRGPALFLDSTAVQNIGFALHELATNASKHGALADPDGRVIVAWSAPANDRVRVDWIEQDGPAVAAPLRKGFGHRVIMELVPHALQGDAGIDFAAEGLRWHLDFPASHVLSMERVAS